MRRKERTIPQSSYETRCVDALDHALEHVPFYHSWKAVDPGPGVPVAERFAALPSLSKREVRANVPRGFMDEEYARRSGFATGEVEIVTTSGTSEERVSVVWHQPWWDRSEREAARIHPVLGRIFESAHREAVLTSPVCAGNLCHIGEASMEERTIGDILFLNQSPDPTSWSTAVMRRMAEEIDTFEPAIIEADPAYLARLSRGCRAAEIALRSPACIVLTYEYPSLIHVRDIAASFPGVPMVSSYGSTETGHVFTQCGHGMFHQNTATCRVDIEPAGADSSVGKILVTTLDNPWFALVRFDVGDLGRVSNVGCPCGRDDGMILSAIEGRWRDATRTTGGRLVTVRELDEALATVPGLADYQVEQIGRASYVARFCAEADVTVHVASVLRDLYGGDAAIDVRREAVIAPEQSGKFRLSRAAAYLPAEERSA